MNSMNDDDKEFSPIRPKSVHEQCHLLIDEILTEFEKVEQENERLRAKVRSQRAELRRLNDAMLRKNARVANAETVSAMCEQIVKTMEEYTGMKVVNITPSTIFDGARLTQIVNPSEYALDDDLPF